MSCFPVGKIRGHPSDLFYLRFALHHGSISKGIGVYSEGTYPLRALWLSLTKEHLVGERNHIFHD